MFIGVFKYGYEKYNIMRVDLVLCFLEKVGWLDDKVIVVEYWVLDNFFDIVEGVDFDKDCEDFEYKLF